ncbi:MAG: fibronectin, partial [Actinobacteria bacterium]|nr:fibronectin [Actinomycetota bacterium]
VILHEMAHGLGFMSGSYYDQATGEGRILQPTPFDAYAQLPDGRRLVDMPSPSLETGKAMTSILYWSGANGVRANNGIRPLLFTPAIYERGSSVSHLDEKTFSNTGENAAMTPNLDAGEVFHLPGSIVLAMFEDLRQKPPAGKVTGVPDSPQNVKAYVSDKSAIIKFDPPPNFRFSQIDNYMIENLQTGVVTTATESPVIMTGLKNGSKYVFSVSAVNSGGSSVAIKSNEVIPEAAWKSSVIDKNADAKYLDHAIFAGKPVVAYTDSKSGDLKLATFNNKWIISTVDGNSANLGKTQNNVAGYISMCTSKENKKDLLHIFYTDLTNKDLKYALYDGKKWKYEIVDGNGERAQDYKEIVRVRGASDVSVSNACAVTSDGVQVFYRDESQGILLGAVKQGNEWIYEIVDGEKDTENRTTGDVGFHLKASVKQDQIHLIYDSVKGFDAERNITRGEIRYATRNSASSLDWKYRNLDLPSDRIYAAGYDVGIYNSSKGVEVGWFTASGSLFPNPDSLKYQELNSLTPKSVQPNSHGTPNSPISIDSKSILFSCEQRLCALNKSNNTTTLISKESIQKGGKSEWITVNKIRYAIAGVSGKLTLFKS